MSFAVIAAGGKQYKVAPGQKVKIEKIEGEIGSSVVFDKVLLSTDGAAHSIGEPYVAGKTVIGTILKQGRHKKLIVFKYHSKTRYRKKKGHRQNYTEVQIGEIK